MISRSPRGAARRRRLALAAAAYLALFAASAAEGTASEWQPLFDGRTLDGWTVEGPSDAFRVIDGTLACGSSGGRLAYTGPAQRVFTGDVEVLAECMTRDGGRADIVIDAGDGTSPRTTLTIDNAPVPRHAAGAPRFDKTGSVRGVRHIFKPVVPDNAWFTLRAVVAQGRLRVWVDDALMTEGPRPATAAAGPDAPRPPVGISIAPSGIGSVLLRALRVRPAGPAPEEDFPPARPSADPRIEALLARGFPVLNLHVHLKGGLTAEQALARSRASGIGYGLAVNVGLGFPTTNDAAALAWLDAVRNHPVFTGVQAEGREWTRLLSPDVAARFDYIFTDAMTITDRRGRRMRLWMPHEVVVEDPEEFMDTLVDRTVEILNREPIDIYANPTFLPAVLAADHDRLWTPSRMRRVVEAAVRNGVAIEISGRLKLPTPAFLRMARDAGAKFTFGTNNAGAEVGDITYCLEMAEALGLAATDMFVPCPGDASAAARRRPWPRPLPPDDKPAGSGRSSRAP